MSPRVHRWLTLVTVCAGLFGTSTAHAQTAAARVGANRPAAGSNAPQVGRPATATAAAAEGAVNINSASEEELRRLPGVGPSRATAIVALRQRVQRFRSADDLMRVRGIGHAGMRRMRPYVTLTGETTLAARPGRAPRRNASAPAGNEGGER